MLALVERDGRVRSFRVPDVTAQSLRPIIVSHVNKATYLMTDDAPVYTAFARAFAGHGTVNHSAEEYVRAAFWHTNTVENFFSIFKRGIYGCYFHVSETHLHRYAAEFDFRHNNRIGLGIDDQTRADRAILSGARGKRLTYETTASRTARNAAALLIAGRARQKTRANCGCLLSTETGRDARPRHRVPSQCQPTQERNSCRSLGMR